MIFLFLDLQVEDNKINCHLKWYIIIATLCFLGDTIWNLYSLFTIDCGNTGHGYNFRAHMYNFMAHMGVTLVYLI